MVTKRYRELRSRLRELERQHAATGFGFAKRWSQEDKLKAIQLGEQMDLELSIIDHNYANLEDRLKRVLTA